jgi:hypothetical protein
MVKQSTHVQWKGCRVCKPHKLRSHGQAWRKSWGELKKIGKYRRVTRHDLGDWMDDGMTPGTNT